MKHLILTALTAALACTLAGPGARADVFHLSGGGKIEGNLVEQQDGRIVIGVGSGTVTVPASMVVRTEKAPPPLEQYKERAARLEPTAEAHVELARWCEDKLLSEQALEHFWKAIELDGENASARARLGYVKVDGEWLPRREAQAARQARQTDRQPADHAMLYRRREWREQFQDLNRGPLSGWIYGDEAQAARKTVLGVTDAAAVEPLAEVFGRQTDAGKRALAVEALGHIGGDQAALALVDLLAAERDDAVAAQARTALAGIGSAGALAKMKTVMRAGSELARTRMAAALADTGGGAMDSVPWLIKNLITREERIIHHEPTESQRSWISHGTHYAYVSDVEPVVAEAAVAWNPVISYLVYGAVLDVKATMQPWNERIWVTVRHPSVLDSLQRLTGQDFGYDLRAWRAWYFRHYLPSKAGDAETPAD